MSTAASSAGTTRTTAWTGWIAFAGAMMLVIAGVWTSSKA